jgi:ATP-dependent helicase/nuclease subunit A
VDFADLEQCALQLLRNPARANEWRARLAQVFVDEYQDINAAQDAIITALSRTGAAANRFMVGDVKQSIYRFRLANPKIFGDYDKRWSRPDADGRRLPLTENFRSREALLTFVNLFFSAVMRPAVGGVPYEALQFGAPGARGALTQKPGDPPCVELHLIAKADDENGADEPASDSSEEKIIPDLPAVQREARLLARRLRELKEKHHQIWDAERKAFRQVEWGDMAVLLRSPSGRAEAFAMEFSKAGVPLIAARDGFFASLEVSDLLNLLRLLDNPLQDVPLAAVLRSPLIGLTLDELAQVRAHNDSRPFWTALARFHKVRSLESNVQGPGSGIQSPESETALRAKVSRFFDQYRRWRELVRHTSLSQCLETALTETHYEALLLAGARGHERMANVRRLLDLARQFDPYQRQGLHRFLRFVEAQAEEDLDRQPAPAPAEDAVRLMSIHRSKGLEFPVVALACLGTRFNERDLNEPVLLNEQYGLCPRITPPDTGHNYPSLPYWVARRSERRELRGEELRLLYVAMTRARDSLILVGSIARNGSKVKCASEPQNPVNTGDVVRTHSHLDWLLKWLPGITVDTDWRDDRTGENKILRWRVYDENDDAFADVVPPPPPVAATGSGGNNANDVALVEQLKAKLAWRYPFEAAVGEAAKTSVSALRRRAVDESDEEARRVFGARAGKIPTKTRATSNSARLSATERGNVYHLFLQLLDLERAASEAELKAQAQRFLETDRMNQAQVGALDFAALNQFWQSDLGQRIRSNAACVRRELPFTARFTPRELAVITGEPMAASNEDFVVVQGVADLAVLRADEIWLVDFKTDETAVDEVSAKVALYEPQLRLYALALERIYRRPITESWLHFLALPKTVRLFPPNQRYRQGELF